MKRLFLFCCFICSVLVSKSQYIQHWGEREGLSNRIVHHAIRTSDGFLWVATANGLNRFDGYHFWSINKSNQTQLSSNLISYLFEDRNKVLWVATDHGIHLFNLTSNHITDVLQHNASDYSLSDNYVLQIFQSSDQTIWVSTADGILHKYLGKSRFQRFNNYTSRDKSFGKRLKITEFQNQIWLRTEDKGLFRIDPNTGKILGRYFTGMPSYEGGLSYIPGTGLLAMMPDGMQVYQPLKDTFQKLPVHFSDEVFAAVLDANKVLWITAADRKKVYQYTGNQLRDITSSLFDFSENVHINNMISANNNNLWICTNNGLYKLINEKPVFSSVLRKDQYLQHLYVPSFRGLMQDKNGDIFMAGYGGLFKQTSDQKIVRLFDNKIPHSPNVLIDEDKKYLWAICEGSGLIKVDKNSGEIRFHDKDKHKYNYLISGIKDTSGTFLLGGYDELAWYHPETNVYHDLQLLFRGRYFVRPFVKYIYRCSDNHIWICTNYGVFVLNRARQIVARYHEDAEDVFRIPANTVNHIYDDKRGNIWLSTEGGGVCVINKIKPAFKVINTENGLANNSVASVISDASGNMWIATYNGLSVLDRKNEQIVNFFKEDGLSDNEFNSGSCLVTKDGWLMFGGVNGINISYKYKPETDIQKYGNKISISYIELLDQKDEIKQIHSLYEINKGVVLSYKSSYLTLYFFNTDFSHPEKNIFFYKLEGLNNRWIPLGEKNSIRFASLSPGNYLLRIKGKGSRNNTDATETILQIQVLEVFYKRWWFILILLLGIGSVFGWLAYLRFQKFKELSALRSKISNDLHDEVGSVLTRVAMQAELIEDDVDAKHREVLKSIVNTCRMAMSNMRDVIWSTDSRYKLVGNLFDKITEMVQQTMESSAVRYKLTFDPELYQMELPPSHKQEIFFIIKEAVHNIVKHSTGDFAELKVYRDGDRLVFSLFNNGDANSPYGQTGSGMYNMVMRAKRMKAELLVDKRNGFHIQLIIFLKSGNLK